MTALRIVLAALAGVTVWLLAVAVPLGVLVGRGIAHADRQRAEAQQRHPSRRARGAA